MKFIGITLINHTPDPLTGHLPSVTERLADVVDTAVLFEELGFDGFGVGERHHEPFISTAPPVVLSHIAAVTARIRLFTAVTLLSVLDPVRVAEDYATLDHLSGGRLELIIGKGNGPEQAELFGITRDQQWDTITENFRLLRRLWTEQRVTWTPSAHGIRQVPLTDATVWPKPLQQPIRIWHGSATSQASVELAAEYGDPVFSANVTNPVEPYAALIDHYRERWVHHGRDPQAVVVGAGSAGHYTAPTSQQAREVYRPIFQAQSAQFARFGIESPFADFDDYLARSSALIGSPQEVVDKVGRYHERLGHTTLHVQADTAGLTPVQHRASLELFQAGVAPELRRTIPDPPWPAPVVDIQHRKAFR
ncbi:LLM class flavin-dependent oxidoreductase [Nakamurella leprariae]|uniref:LLM class flavin-dependent oxidoreductase n=1 Tax=Nakamurella leprariae TaxID=2803911 RepID=A0A938YC90_9ACTN|nr:LLM class flavin-dependent oxidoreductase [Nakamurella leprariae]MBM9465832.1 LLM class flavin-dependent oxidoreductase [Nakamurella leprariae]